MFYEVHRHLLLYRKLHDGRALRFRHIIVIEKEVFEVRLVEGEIAQIDPADVVGVACAEVHPYCDLAPAIKHAETEYIKCVRKGWRAYDPTVASFLMLARSRAA